MTDPRPCTRCSATVLDRYLCRPCETRLAAELQSVPVLLAELDTTLARLGHQSDGGPTTNPQPILDETVSTTAAALRSTCQHWATHLGHNPRDHAPWHWLWQNTEHIAARYPHADRILRDLETHTGTAWRKIDRPPDRWYAGPCDAEIPHPDGILRCGRILWADLDDTVITCPQCRTRWDVADRRAYLLAWAEDAIVTVAEAVSILTLMTRRRISRSTVSMWITRGPIIPVEVNPRYKFRLGDTFPLIARHEPTHESETA